MTNFVYTPMLKNQVNSCHENYAFFHSANKFIFEEENSMYFCGRNERFGTHEKLTWGCKVGQVSSRGTTVFLCFFSDFSLIFMNMQIR